MTRKWIFDKPNDSDPGLQKAWDHILEAVDSNSLEPKSVVDIFSKLSSAPYGVADGFVPVLFCAYLLVNNITIALYEEGAFVPELSVPVLERLMRRPGNFSVLEFGLGGERSAVVERFARGFKVNDGVLPVWSSLYAMAFCAVSHLSFEDYKCYSDVLFVRERNPSFVDSHFHCLCLRSTS